MELRDSDKTTVNLIPGNISMVGDTVLVQYIVENWSLEHRDKGNMQYIKRSLKNKKIQIQNISFHRKSQSWNTTNPGVEKKNNQ